MPLAYPSALDRRPPVAQIRGGRRPTWRGFGARASYARLKKRRLKQTLMASFYFSAGAEGLSLSGGASIQCSVFVTLGITSGSEIDRSPSETTKATHSGPPSMDRYAARELARTPPSEGEDVSELAPRIEAVPARLGQRDWHRFADGCWAVEVGQHGLVVGAS
jgi:hypothetical protein